MIPCPIIPAFVDSEDSSMTSRPSGSSSMSSCSSQGFNVVLADGGASAFEVLRASHRGRLRSSSATILMPGLDGLEVIRRICSKQPGLNVIFISGHLSDVSWWPTPTCGSTGSWRSPLENAQLIAAVREALARLERLGLRPDDMDINLILSAQTLRLAPQIQRSEVVNGAFVHERTSRGRPTFA